MGGQKSLLALIDNLDRERIIPYLLLQDEGELVNLAHKRNIQVFKQNIPGFKPTNLFKLFKIRNNIRKIVRKNEIEIIHSDDAKFAYFSTFIAKNVKTVYHARVTEGRKYDKLLEKRINKVVGISKATRQRFNKTLENERFKVIHNGVDCELFNDNYDKLEIRNKLGIELDKKILVFVGQIKKTKGLVEIIEAANLLRNSKDFKIYLLGKEPEPGLKQGFVDLINKYELSDTISFVGQKSNVNEWLQAADVVLFPSHEGAEGMGRVPFEAMATSTPVIATDISGVNEAVTSDVGVLVDQENPEQLAKAINRLFNDENLYSKLAANGRKRALELFDIKVHARNMMDLFEELVCDGV
jgi:glycosyltransferase involved in cell wall biosynthesis